MDRPEFLRRAPVHSDGGSGAPTAGRACEGRRRSTGTVGRLRGRPPRAASGHSPGCTSPRLDSRTHTRRTNAHRPRRPGSPAGRDLRSIRPWHARGTGRAQHDGAPCMQAVASQSGGWGASGKAANLFMPGAPSFCAPSHPAARIQSPSGGGAPPPEGRPRYANATDAAITAPRPTQRSDSRGSKPPPTFDRLGTHRDQYNLSAAELTPAAYKRELARTAAERASPAHDTATGGRDKPRRR